MIFQLILARNGNVVYDESFMPDRRPLEYSLLFGLVTAMKSLSQGMGPAALQSFQTMSTNEYKLHYFESPSLYQFMIFTSPESKSLHQELQLIYSKLFIPLVLRNPLFVLGSSVSFSDSCPAFVHQLRSRLLANPS
jgi:hypothetical protein